MTEQQVEEILREGTRPKPRGMAGNSPPDRAPGTDSPVQARFGGLRGLFP